MFNAVGVPPTKNVCRPELTFQFSRKSTCQISIEPPELPVYFGSVIFARTTSGLLLPIPLRFVVERTPTLVVSPPNKVRSFHIAESGRESVPTIHTLRSVI